MPEVPADPVLAVVAILLADADVAARVSARGFGGELPASETAMMPRPCFVVRASGGPSLTEGSYARADTQRVDLFAYAETAQAAGALADLIALKLRQVRRQVAEGTLVHWVKSAGGYASGREPVTEWPRAFRSFQVFHGLVSVS